MRSILFITFSFFLSSANSQYYYQNTTFWTRTVSDGGGCWNPGEAGFCAPGGSTAGCGQFNSLTPNATIFNGTLAIPLNSTITHIQLDVTRYAPAGGANWTMLGLVYQDTMYPTNPSSAVWSSTKINETYTNFSGKSSWTPSELNDVTFGVRWQVFTIGSPGVATLTCVLVSVQYTLPTASPSISPSPSQPPSSSPSSSPSPSAVPPSSSASPSITPSTTTTPSTSPSTTPSITPNSSHSASVSPSSASISPSTSSSFSTPSISPSSSSQTPSPSSGTSSSSGNSSKLGLVIGIVVGGVVSLSLAVAGISFVLMKRKRQKEEVLNFELGPSDNTAPTTTTTNRTSAKDFWEIDYTKIKIERQIGKGGFGVIYLAKWRNQACVVKQLDQTKENSAQEFLKEANNVKLLRPHPNICLVLGICSNPSYPLCLVMEYVPNGSLWAMRVSNALKLDTKSVIDYALDIASGMLHLHSEDIIHCDLACRNVLVGSKDSSHYILKITDFGLSRVTEKEAYNASSTSLFPVRWSAPEVLTQKLVSKPMDVWSFGITIWEMIEAKLPYFLLTNADVVNAVCEQNVRLARPTSVPIPDVLFDLMESCWNHDPQLRPTFEHICDSLATIKQKYTSQGITRTENTYHNISNNDSQSDNQRTYNNILNMNN